ncbi:MAG: (2Fe-2S)-binding protein [Coriobacteriales bacterium]|jgi:NADH-quinone oxidoreductase subunit G|nr:(2Fe-2S)-binding protein [Coriobacteriales bacterium]
MVATNSATNSATSAAGSTAAGSTAAASAAATSTTAAAQKTAKVALSIDGVSVTAPATMTIAAAARLAGVEIPTLCFQYNLNDVGACRVCLVQLEGEDQLVASCNTQVQEGMVVHTNSPAALKARRLNLELLLSQHDVQCTTCVRSGNCRLQTLANDLNIADERFPKRLEDSSWDMGFPLIREAAKCVKCWRCVQVCENIQATHIWGMKNRATRTTVGVNDALEISETLCTVCGQCVTHCPTGALRERDDTQRVLDAIADPNKVSMIQIAPSVRTAWGEPLGLSHEQATVRRLVAALRKVGFNYIFDTDFSADLTITEEASEFVQRLTHASEHPWPMFTSCCPGWMRWVKGHHPELTDNLSTAKSPQGMFGAVAKTYFAETINKKPEEIFSTSAMPCLAKKMEAAQPNLDSTGTGPDVDAVLTVREIARLIKSLNINVAALPEEDFDQPFGIGSGAGEIFGATGGVMEAALRTGYYYVTGENPDPDAFAEVRGLDGWKEARFELPAAGEAPTNACAPDSESICPGSVWGSDATTCGNGVVGPDGAGANWPEDGRAMISRRLPNLRVAVASGLGNAEKLIGALQRGEVAYDFVEVMACPGGCVCGGGQPITETASMAALRGGILYGLDKRNSYRFSHENPAIKAVYANYFGEPLSQKSHHLLHADHRAWKMPNEEK